MPTTITGRPLSIAPEFRGWRHRLGPNTAEILFDLIDLATATPDGLVLCLPLRTIATAAGTSKDSVRRTIRHLEAARILERLPGDDGPLTTRTYLLHLEAAGITVAA